MITNTGIIIMSDKKDRISELKFKDVQTYVVGKDGMLAVIHDENAVIDVAGLQNAISLFTPVVSKSEEAGKKTKGSITLDDVVSILIEKGIIPKP